MLTTTSASAQQPAEHVLALVGAGVDGHPDDLPVKRALEELRFFTTDVKILGVYPADPFRDS